MFKCSDIDILIILKLSESKSLGEKRETEKDIANYFQINKKTREISNNEHLWRQLVIKKYGFHLGNVEDIREKYLNGKTWKEYYMMYVGSRYGSSGFFLSGRRYVGLHVTKYYSSDTPERENRQHFNRKGELDGLQESHEITGKGNSVILREQHTNYKDGKKHGPDRIYYFNILFSETYYYEGFKHGTEKEWYENYENDNHQIKKIHNYVNGKPEGEVIGWYPDGKLQYHREFKDGVIIKDMKWDEDGNERKVLSNGSEMILVNNEWVEKE